MKGEFKIQPLLKGIGKVATSIRRRPHDCQIDLVGCALVQNSPAGNQGSEAHPSRSVFANYKTGLAPMCSFQILQRKKRVESCEDSSSKDATVISKSKSYVQKNTKVIKQERRSEESSEESSSDYEEPQKKKNKETNKKVAYEPTNKKAKTGPNKRKK